MTSLKKIVAELAKEPRLWWGYNSQHGWIIMDRMDGRNVGDSRILIRCRDWSQFEVSRSDFSSDRFVYFKTHVASLPSDLAQQACDSLLALSNEFASQLEGFRVTEADLERQRREAWLEEQHRTQEDWRERQEAEQQSLIQGGWRTCANPGALLGCLGRPLSTRKARLFSIACCRRVWDLLTYKDCRNAILLAERLEVGELAQDDVRKVRVEMRAKWVATRTQRHSGWRGKIRRGFLGLVDRLLQDSETPA